jgi:flagellar basal body-associated protein FliL
MLHYYYEKHKAEIREKNRKKSKITVRLIYLILIVALVVVSYRSYKVLNSKSTKAKLEKKLFKLAVYGRMSHLACYAPFRTVLLTETILLAF